MGTTMRLADYVMKTLAESGIDTCFLVTGGMAMHLDDALLNAPGIRPICCHHEQAATFAAEGYGHVTGRPALALVTAGPGAINALTGVFSAYVDSIPMLVIAGQSRSDLIRSKYNFGNGMRQIGEQETDSVALATPVTKYANRISDPSRIRFELEKCLNIATSGRPGPCWLEIPVDLQAVQIVPDDLAVFPTWKPEPPDLSNKARSIMSRWKDAKRPLIVAGPGIREAGAVELFETVASNLGCPLIGAGPQDAVATDHPQYAGKIGTVGTRAGNLAVQNADLILFVGMRCYLSQVTYNWPELGRRAHKIMVDEDVAEFSKPCSVADEGIVADAGTFLSALAPVSAGFDSTRHESWLEFCRERVRLFPPVTDSMRTVKEDGRINPYWFIEEFCARLTADDIIAACNASASILPIQAGPSVRGQRFFSNLGCGAMGFALPAAVGAATAPRTKRVICMIGDGSLMMNLQELETIAHHKMPIVVVVLENDGYISIIQSQKNIFGREVGSSPDTGVTCPDFMAVAKAFGLECAEIYGPDFRQQIDAALLKTGPMVIVAHLDSEQGFEPKVAARKLEDGSMVSSSPEDMFPFLSRGELKKHILWNTEEE